MNANCCPNCEKDLTDSVNFALIACVNAGASGVADITCPRCRKALQVTVQVSAKLTERALVS